MALCPSREVAGVAPWGFTGETEGEAREGEEVAGAAREEKKRAGREWQADCKRANMRGNHRECQVDKNAKGNCQTVGYMIFRILLKTKNAKGNCQTIGVALILFCKSHKAIYTGPLLLLVQVTINAYMCPSELCVTIVHSSRCCQFFYFCLWMIQMEKKFMTLHGSHFTDTGTGALLRC
jgi:hypothetical protein